MLKMLQHRLHRGGNWSTKKYDWSCIDLKQNQSQKASESMQLERKIRGKQQDLAWAVSDALQMLHVQPRAGGCLTRAAESRLEDAERFSVTSQSLNTPWALPTSTLSWKGEAQNLCHALFLLWRVSSTERRDCRSDYCGKAQRKEWDLDQVYRMPRRSTLGRTHERRLRDELERPHQGQEYSTMRK